MGGWKIEQALAAWASGVLYRAGIEALPDRPAHVLEFFPAALAQRSQGQVLAKPGCEAEFNRQLSAFRQMALWCVHAVGYPLAPVREVVDSHGTCCLRMALPPGQPLLRALMAEDSTQQRPVLRQALAGFLKEAAELQTHGLRHATWELSSFWLDERSRLLALMPPLKSVHGSDHAATASTSAVTGMARLMRSVMWHVGWTGEAGVTTRAARDPWWPLIQRCSDEQASGCPQNLESFEQQLRQADESMAVLKLVPEAASRGPSAPEGPARKPASMRSGLPTRQTGLRAAVQKLAASAALCAAAVALVFMNVPGTFDSMSETGGLPQSQAEVPPAPTSGMLPAPQPTPSRYQRSDSRSVPAQSLAWTEPGEAASTAETARGTVRATSPASPAPQVAAGAGPHSLLLASAPAQVPAPVATRQLMPLGCAAHLLEQSLGARAAPIQETCE